MTVFNSGRFTFDNAQLTALALRAKSDKQSFNELGSQLKPWLEAEAEKFGKKFGIDRDEMLSTFFFNLIDAVDGFDGSTQFLQRLRTRLYSRAVGLYRKEMTKKNSPNHGAYSLNTSVNSEADYEMTFQDLLVADVNIEDDLVENEMKSQVISVLRKFSQKNEKYAHVVFLKIVEELDNDQLAAALGFESYSDANCRKTVQRSMDAFRKFGQAALA